MMDGMEAASIGRVSHLAARLRMIEIWRSLANLDRDEVFVAQVFTHEPPRVMTLPNDETRDAPREPTSSRPRYDEAAMTTALSTLTARVAVLERWMRRSRRREELLIGATAVAVLTCLAVLALR